MSNVNTPGVNPFYDNIKVNSAQQVIAVTPTNSTALPNGVARGFFVGAAGNVTATDTAGNNFVVVVPANLVGAPFWIAITQVQSTGTTATGIYALY